MHTDGLIVGFEGCAQMVDHLENLSGYNCRLSSKPDTRGFQLIGGDVKIHLKGDNWIGN